MKTTTPTFTVEVVEHDSWSGAKLDHKRSFKRKCDAMRYANRINSRNTAAQVPDYYLTASLKGESLCGFRRS